MKLRSLAFVAAAALAGSALAQISSSSMTLKTTSPSNWYFNNFLPTTSPGSGTTTATGSFNPGTGANFSGGDVFSQGWFWLRSGADQREYQLWQQWTGSMVGTNRAQMTYRQNAGSLVRAVEVALDYRLIAIDATRAYVQIDWSAKNLHSAALATDVYAFMDLNRPDTTNAAGDSGSYGASGFRFGDANPAKFTTFSFGGLAPTSWEMNLASTLKAKLTDNTAAGNLANSVVAATGDLAGAYHYALTLAPGESKGGRVTLGYNVVPEPATGLVLLAALAGLRARRRPA